MTCCLMAGKRPVRCQIFVVKLRLKNNKKIDFVNKKAPRMQITGLFLLIDAGFFLFLKITWFFATQIQVRNQMRNIKDVNNQIAVGVC